MERGTIYNTGLYIQWLTEAIIELRAHDKYSPAAPALEIIREDLQAKGTRPVDVAPVKEAV